MFLAGKKGITVITHSHFIFVIQLWDLSHVIRTVTTKNFTTVAAMVLPPKKSKRQLTFLAMGDRIVIYPLGPIVIINICVFVLYLREKSIGTDCERCAKHLIFIKRAEGFSSLSSAIAEIKDLTRLRRNTTEWNDSTNRSPQT
jgi:hypothetical protein